MTRPRLLDLFCNAGGAAVGYYRAGFEVVGVDIEPMPRYPFEFHQADALTYPLEGFDAIHASPPCQDYSVTRNLGNAGHERKQYPRLIGPVRERLIASGAPWVIENVPTPELVRQPTLDGAYGIELCGSMFGLTAPWRGRTVYLQRHRVFETSWLAAQPACRHEIGYAAVTVAGHGRMGGGDEIWRGKGFNQLRRQVMGIDWMTNDELNEAIPPAYAEYVGCQLLEHMAAAPASR